MPKTIRKKTFDPNKRNTNCFTSLKLSFSSPIKTGVCKKHKLYITEFKLFFWTISIALLKRLSFNKRY